jgi:DNA-binding MarR family transcriptional regulator
MSKIATALAYLRERGEARGTELARLLQISPHSVSAYLRRPLDAGIVIRKIRYGGRRGHYRIWRLATKGTS